MGHWVSYDAVRKAKFNRFDQSQGEILSAHDNGAIWDMDWHPYGHILCTGSNDQSTKFWTRNRPGDDMKDKYNVLMLPVELRKAAIRSIIEAGKNQD